MIWLYFNNESDANSAMNTINTRLGIPDGVGTTTWAEPLECVNGTWAFAKPTCDLTDIPTHTEKEFDKTVDLGLGNSPEDAET